MDNQWSFCLPTSNQEVSLSTVDEEVSGKGFSDESAPFAWVVAKRQEATFLCAGLCRREIFKIRVYQREFSRFEDQLV